VIVAVAVRPVAFIAVRAVALVAVRAVTRAGRIFLAGLPRRVVAVVAGRGAVLDVAGRRPVVFVLGRAVVRMVVAMGEPRRHVMVVADGAAARGVVPMSHRPAVRGAALPSLACLARRDVMPVPEPVTVVRALVLILRPLGLLSRRR
jgi:hypothetical protein